jgi:hypothetical protein
MSPLWSDMALARAAWANAANRGLVDRDPPKKAKGEPKADFAPDLPRRPIRRPVTSFAL